jgi:hypothetical protein
MRSLLAIGNSHLNSLKLSEAHARDCPGVDPSFAYSSAEAWYSIPVRAEGGVLQFRKDPQSHFAAYAPVPSFVRQLPGGLRVSTFQDIVVGQVGTSPAGITFFTQNRLPGAEGLPRRNTVSWDLFSEIVEPANVMHAPHPRPSWSSLPYQSKHAFSLRALLRLVANLAPDARRSYVPAHPPFIFPDASPGVIEAHRIAWREYLGVIERVCSENGFRLVPPPKESFDSTGVFTDLRYSANPEQRDSHLNAEYGRLLWNDLMSGIE